jgi:hypothetical protein
MNLLSAPDQTHNNRPVPVAIQIGNEELRLRPIEVRDFLAAAHKVGCLLPGPCSLGFVENYYVIIWGRRGAKTFVAKMVDILDKRLYPLTDNSLAFRVANPNQLVSNQCFLKNRNQRAISRQVYRTSITETASTRRDVQADECLSGARYTGYEDDCLFARTPGTFDDFFDSGRRNSQISRTRIVT